MDRIQTQASKIWDLLFANETAATYQKALNLTGTFLTELAQLVWLIVCSVFVFGAWVGDASMKAGQSIREWVDRQSSGAVKPASQKSVTAAGKSLLDTGRDGAAYLLAQAREQLGLESAPPASQTKTAGVSIPPQPAPPEPTQLPVAAVPEQPRGYGSAEPPGSPADEDLVDETDEAVDDDRSPEDDI